MRGKLLSILLVTLMITPIFLGTANVEAGRGFGSWPRPTLNEVYENETALPLNLLFDNETKSYILEISTTFYVNGSLKFTLPTILVEGQEYLVISMINRRIFISLNPEIEPNQNHRNILIKIDSKDGNVIKIRLNRLLELDLQDNGTPIGKKLFRLLKFLKNQRKGGKTLMTILCTPSLDYPERRVLVIDDGPKNVGPVIPLISLQSRSHLQIPFLRYIFKVLNRNINISEMIFMNYEVI